MSYTRVCLAERPKTVIDANTFRDERAAIPTADDLKEGDYLVKVKLVSLDPTLRGQISGQLGYVAPVAIGAVMRARGIGEVVQSKSPVLKVGDLAFGPMGFSEYVIGRAGDHQKVTNSPGVPLEDHLGVLGMTGRTAWYGMNVVAGGTKPGETVLVSGAAGATGSVAGQLAKIAGAKVIGIAGGQAKCDYITKELGFDVALDYKSETFHSDFKEATKDGFDVYYDNVGGEILDMALLAANDFARFVMCGGISQYNLDKPDPLYNVRQITPKRLKLEGFIILDHADRFPEMLEDLGSLLKSGKLKSRTHVLEGSVTGLPNALKMLFEGVNTGKLIYRLK